MTLCEDRNAYILTVRYGKESLAEFEVGDALFPYDHEVQIKKTAFGGVLVLCTSLQFHELLSALLTFPPVTLERIVPIISCCSTGNDKDYIINCVIDTIVREKLKYKRVRFGRRGCLSKNQFKLLEEKLRKLSTPGSSNTLLIEPLDNAVCIGIVEDNMDKLFKENVMKIQPYRKQ